LDLGKEVIVRASATHPTEVLLERSVREGEEMRLCFSRAMLARALDLGFTRFAMTKADAPVLCEGEDRTLVFVPFDPKMAIRPKPNARRIKVEGKKGEDAPAATSRSTAPHAIGNGISNNGNIQGAPDGHAN